MSVGVGRVFVHVESSVLDICYSYLSQFYHKWRSHRSSSVLLVELAVEFKVGVVKTDGYKGLDCGSRYVGWKEMGFVLEVEYGGREGYLHVTRGVEGFDVQGSVVGEVGMSSSIKVLFEVVGVFEADGAVG